MHTYQYVSFFMTFNRYPLFQMILINPGKRNKTGLKQFDPKPIERFDYLL